MADHLIVRPEGHLVMNDAGELIIRNSGRLLTEPSGGALLTEPSGGALLLQGGCCCRETIDGVLCGECINILPATATVDYGALTLTSVNCPSECANFTGQFILSGGSPSCSWSYRDDAFCSIGYYIVLEYRVQIWAGIVYGLTGWIYRVITQFEFNNKPIGSGEDVPDNWVWVRKVVYEAGVSTSCVAATFPLTKASDEFYGEPYICSGTFPTTINLIVP